MLAKQAELETAKLNFDFTQVTSPIDGRTSTFNFTVGNLITAGDLTSSGILTSVVSVDPIYVYSNVDSRFYSHTGPGLFDHGSATAGFRFP